MWKTLDRFLDLRSRWMALIGEHLQDERGKVLEYWRVEKADSAVIVTLQGDRLILPQRMYRPGVQAATLDFPGGRVPEGEEPDGVVATILQRELGIAPGAIARVQWLNSDGWWVNSSFSNQRLYAAVAEIDPEATIPEGWVGARYAATELGVRELLRELRCLQCRAAVLEWWMQCGQFYDSW